MWESPKVNQGISDTKTNGPSTTFHWEHDDDDDNGNNKWRVLSHRPRDVNPQLLMISWTLSSASNERKSESSPKSTRRKQMKWMCVDYIRWSIIGQWFLLFVQASTFVLSLGICSHPQPSAWQIYLFSSHKAAQSFRQLFLIKWLATDSSESSTFKCLSPSSSSSPLRGNQRCVTAKPIPSIPHPDRIYLSFYARILIPPPLLSIAVIQCVAN